MILPMPGAMPQKAGSASKPFFGIKVAIMDRNNKEVIGEGEGDLCMS